MPWHAPSRGRAGPREQVRSTSGRARVCVEHRARRQLHLDVGEHRGPDLVGVVGAELARVGRRRSASRVRVDVRRSARPARTAVRVRGGGARQIEEQAHLVGGRADQQRDFGGRAGGERGERRSRQHVAVDHRVERHHPDRARAGRRHRRDLGRRSTASTGDVERAHRASSRSRRRTRRAPIAARVVVERGERCAALHDRARERAARDCGDAQRCSTSPPPADSPNAVTRAGSPPNAAMLSRTHSSAAIASRTPQFATPPSGRASRKPSAPSR